MAIFTPIEIVKQIMDEERAYFWQVTGPDKAKIASNYSTDVTAQSSYQKLSTLLSELSGDYVIVKLFTKVPRSTGNEEGGRIFTYNVRLQGGGGSQAINGPSQANVDTLVALKLLEQKMEYERKLDKLERALEDRETAVTGFDWGKEIYGLLKPVISGFLMQGVKDKAVTKDVETEIATVEPGTIAKSIASIKNVMNGQTIDAIEALGYYAKHEPENFKNMAGMLLAGLPQYRELEKQKSDE
jgi:hypothetical protein